jgi:hypothetical protein
MAASESQNGVVVRELFAQRISRKTVTSSTKAFSHLTRGGQRVGANIERFNIVKRQNFERRDVIARQNGLGCCPARSWNTPSPKRTPISSVKADVASNASSPSRPMRYHAAQTKNKSHALHQNCTTLSQVSAACASAPKPLNEKPG